MAINAAGGFGINLNTGVVSQYTPPTVVTVGTVTLPAPAPTPMVQTGTVA
jgi:hypothetical protein